MKWTAEQQQAIDESGSDILVAAAAGSGKTAVLVERIIQKVVSTENPMDIDALLVVTFTNAAAQEMRTRVGTALEQALQDHPTSLHLKKQLSLLQRSSISTLHSFCMDVVKQYAYAIDVDPAFRIVDDMEAELMKQEVMDELFETWYGQEEQTSFFSVVDRFSTDRSDADVEKLILHIYNFSKQHPWPNEWLNQLAEIYMIPEDWEEDELEWLTMLKQEVAHQLDAMEQELEFAENVSREPDGHYPYIETIEKDLEVVKEMRARADNWGELYNYMSQASLARLSGKRAESNPDKKERAKAYRDSFKKRWDDLKKAYFTRALSDHVEDMQELAPVVKEVTNLVKQFMDSYDQAKREKAVVDFSDLEHFCLQLLTDESSTPENVIPSSIAREYQEKFTEVFVDEYQDTNLVQETILSMLSAQEGPGNMFMVGDVKQSIYRFRHAEPSLFIGKYNAFGEANHPATRIDLARNFRSREHVLSGVNFIFKQVMDEEVGEITYDQAAALIYGNTSFDELPFPEEAPSCIIIDRDDKRDEEAEKHASDVSEMEQGLMEARVYSQEIKKWIGHETGEPLQVVDADTKKQRDVTYRDIVILLRSMTWAPTILEEFKEQGIPVYAELSTGYFDAIEIKIMLNMLKVIDNPYQDIPLASVLRSPMVGFDEEQLTTIRLENRSDSYYEALQAYTRNHTNETSTRVQQFMTQLSMFRSAARQGALSELIWDIYRETGYYDFVGGMPGGRQRQANLRALYDRARSYESTSFRGLYRFLRFIEHMEEQGDDLGAARALSEQEDVVRIMTIHSSKGLEFPVVIVGGMYREFNKQDIRGKYIVHKDYGFATKYIDVVKRITYPTLYFYALQKEVEKESLAEEMRVLYVALTRAKEKIVMVGTVPSFEKKQEAWEMVANHQQPLLPRFARAETNRYLDWIGPSLMRHKDSVLLHGENGIDPSIPSELVHDKSAWDVKVVPAYTLLDVENTYEEEKDIIQAHIKNWKPIELSNKNVDKNVRNRLSYHYPYEVATHTRAKQSVTEIKRQQELKDVYSDERFVHKQNKPLTKRPQFMQTKKELSPSEIGTAMHTVMQHIPLNKKMKNEELETFILTLVEKEMFTQEEANVIDRRAIQAFFDTPLAAMMRKARHVQREIPFSYTLPAEDVYPEWKESQDERVLIQGVIDCLIPVEDGYIIVDYKTDHISEKPFNVAEKKLKERYQTQVNLYAQAIEGILQKKIKGVYLYFFDADWTIQMQ